MTEQYLSEIRARLSGITPGPWTVDLDDFTYVVRSPDGVTLMFALRDKANDAEVQTVVELAAHARADIPALLAEVERLQKQLDRAEAVVERMNEELSNALDVMNSQAQEMRRGGL